MIFNIIFCCLIGILLIVIFISAFKKRAFISLFDSGNVIVTGMRGRGKDVAFCLVINARKRDYISNIQYSDPKKRYKRFPLDLKVWELSGNTYTDLISGSVKSYVYPYPDGLDYYISDSGIYFPAQYQAELCRKYKAAPMFQALSRHLGECNVHCNVQNLARLWDKIREQSDIYVRMDKCKFIGKSKFCFVRAYSYSDIDSCMKAVIPPRFGIGKAGREARYNFEITHGKIIKYSFIARLPYNFDSRRFKKLLENNLIEYEQ